MISSGRSIWCSKRALMPKLNKEISRNKTKQNKANAKETDSNEKKEETRTPRRTVSLSCIECEPN